MIPWLSGELPHVLRTLRSLFHAEASASYHLVHQTVNISFLVFKLPASLGTALAVPERRRAHRLSQLDAPHHRRPDGVHNLGAGAHILCAIL